MGIQHYFIRSRLVKRFTLLNQAVVKLVWEARKRLFLFMGMMNWENCRIITPYSRAAQCAKTATEQEITDRKVIEADLRATQDD